MVPVEAFASGTPVLGVADGFTQYQVRDGENGRLYDRGELSATIAQFERDGVAWSSDRIQAFANQYSTERFREQLLDAVDDAVERDRIVVDDPTAAEFDAGDIEQRAVADGGDE